MEGFRKLQEPDDFEQEVTIKNSDGNITLSTSTATPARAASSTGLAARKGVSGPGGFGDAGEEYNAHHQVSTYMGDSGSAGMESDDQDESDMPYENPNDMHNPFMPYRFD